MQRNQAQYDLLREVVKALFRKTGYRRGVRRTFTQAQLKKWIREALPTQLQRQLGVKSRAQLVAVMEERFLLTRGSVGYKGRRNRRLQMTASAFDMIGRSHVGWFREGEPYRPGVCYDGDVSTSLQIDEALRRVLHHIFEQTGYHLNEIPTFPEDLVRQAIRRTATDDKLGKLGFEQIGDVMDMLLDHMLLSRCDEDRLTGACLEGDWYSISVSGFALIGEHPYGQKPSSRPTNVGATADSSVRGEEPNRHRSRVNKQKIPWELRLFYFWKSTGGSDFSRDEISAESFGGGVSKGTLKSYLGRARKEGYIRCAENHPNACYWLKAPSPPQVTRLEMPWSDRLVHLWDSTGGRDFYHHHLTPESFGGGISTDSIRAYISRAQEEGYIWRESRRFTVPWTWLKRPSA